MAGRETQGLRKHAQKAQKVPSAPPFCAFCACSLGASFSREPAGGVTVEDALDVVPGATVVSEPRSIPAGHLALLEAARAAGFPWLRLRPGLAIAGDEDGWRAWLEGWVSPADLGLARRLLAGRYGLVTRATLGREP
jgi:hypothetical protein